MQVKKVAVNGTFDILHPGHLALIDFAAEQGAYLLVAIDSDRRIQELKGPKRPINTTDERKTLLEHIKRVDEVVVFSTNKELEKIYEDYKPDVLVIGSDYKGKEIVGGKYCKEIIYYDRIEGYSTTSKIQNIIDRG